MRPSWLVGASAIGLIVATQASAQSANNGTGTNPNASAAPLTTDTAGSGGAEIIVTASKRQTTLQDTPIAVSVTSAATIQQAQIRDLIDLQSVVPSLRVQQQVNSGATNFFIRGFGNGAGNPGIEPSVGVFIDGVYRSRSAGQISDLTDVERVEVLRGPQSTLFGKNASAGVISIITKSPKNEFGGSAELDYGNYNQFVGKFDITGPLIKDVLAFDVNGGFDHRAGYAHDLNTGATLNNRHRWNIGAQLLYTPSPDLTVRLIGDYSNINEVCCNVVNVVAGPTAPAINFLAASAGRGPGLVANAPFSDQQRTNQVPINRVKNYGGSGQIDYKFSNMQLTSITAYRQLRSYSNEDGDFTAASILANQPTTLNVNDFTQELRLASNFHGPLNFLIGGFFLDEHLRNSQDNVLGTDARPYVDLLSGGAITKIEQAFGAPAGYFFAPGDGEFAAFRLHDQSFSAFGQVDFKATDKLTLTGGLNFTEDRKHASSQVTSTEPFAAIDLVAAGTLLGVPPALAANPMVNPLLALQPLQFQPPFLNFPNAVESGRTSDNNVSYTLRAAYKFDRHVNAYASYATGFKPSSFNLTNDSRPFASQFIPGSPVSNPAPSPIRSAGLALPNLITGTRYAGPEKSRNAELGLKLAYPHFTFNADIFYEKILGFQTLEYTGTGYNLSNAGKERVYGLEFDSSWTPVRPLTFFASATLLRPKYLSFPTSGFGDLSGFTPAGIPKLNTSIGAAYTQPLSDRATLILRTDFNYTSRTQLVDGESDYGPNAIAEARKFTQEVNNLDASATLRLASRFEVSGYVRNALNDRYLVGIFPGVAQQGSVEGFTNQPRTYGASVRYTF